jgi:hypothetical protein
MVRKNGDGEKKIEIRGILTVIAFPIQLQMGDGIGGLLWQGYGGVAAETAVAHLGAKI